MCNGDSKTKGFPYSHMRVPKQHATDCKAGPVPLLECIYIYIYAPEKAGLINK